VLEKNVLVSSNIITSALYLYTHQKNEIPSSILPSFPVVWPDLTSRMQQAPPLTYSVMQVDQLEKCIASQN